jgi:K+/H+ antiporter YhaU regulatory subunit KhtT
VIEEGGAEEDRAGALGLFLVAVPDKLAGKKLGESGISARTGLSVLAIQKGETVVTNPSASTELLSDAELLMLGTSAQREQFVRTFA